MAFKPVVKHAVVGLSIAGILFGLATYGANHGWPGIPSNVGKVLAPKHYDLPPLAEAKIANVPPAPYPGTKCASIAAPVILGEHWEWSAQMGLEWANGGNCTTEGSLMAKRGVNYKFVVQNDTNQMMADLVSCAKEIHDAGGGPEATCSSGANLIAIMGDQAHEVAAQVNPQLLKLGPDYGLKLIGAVGYSRGEDACMLPPNMKDNPHSIATTPMYSADGTEQKEHGVLVTASVREGDWNICEKWQGDNALPNNPDPTTFDADAVNWVEEKDYTTAAQDYVAGKCEDRREVVKGKLTGNHVHVCVNGTATWTPGDVTVAKQRGGLVKVADSLMYRSQMPSVLVGSGHFLGQHKEEVKNLLRAAWDGADQINAYPTSVLPRAAALQTAMYKDDGGVPQYHGGAYWQHYFHPVTEKDKQGLTVSLGGSAVSNYADNIILFGLDGNNYNMLADYNIFKNIDVQQYPQIYRENGPTPPVDAKLVIDRSYIQSIKDDIEAGDNSGVTVQADTQNYSTPDTGVVVSQRPYNINFATGSAQPLPDGVDTLKGLKDSIAITGLKVKIDGYTDNTGSASINTSLSQARAAEVKTWLQQNAGRNFPDSRFVSVEGHGPADPVASNDTAQGKAQNRRVTITLVQ